MRLVLPLVKKKKQSRIKEFISIFNFSKPQCQVLSSIFLKSNLKANLKYYLINIAERPKKLI